MKKFLVYGMSDSGIAATELLLFKKKTVFCKDDNIKLKKQLSKKYQNFIFVDDSFDISDLDCIVVSPSIDLYNPLLVLARSKNIKIISELELGFLYHRKRNIAITGTNGKTTTTQLLTEMLKSKYSCKSVGNIGFPISKAVLNNKKDLFVIEVSSFMLENIDKFRAKYSAITNITSDHIDRHKNIECYHSAKLNLVNNIKRKDCLVINLDDNNSFKVMENCISKRMYVSTYSICVGCYTIDDEIYYKKSINSSPEKIINISEIDIRLVQNITNVLIAILIAKKYKITTQNIIYSLKNFKIANHRYQSIFINDIEYVNDSKSTNVSSTISACLNSKKDTILMIGGADKKLNYKSLFKNLPSNIEKIIIYGEIKDKIKSDAKGINIYNIDVVDSMKDAVLLAKRLATKNCRVLFSPATSSFDEFSNYKQRGKAFLKLVKDEKFK